MRVHLGIAMRALLPAAVLVAMSAIPAASQTLTVSVAGSGKVTGTGIDCPSDCSENIPALPARIGVRPSPAPAPRTVVLTATPTLGSSFKEWGGSCAAANTATTCTVTIPSGTDLTISAVFSSPTAALSRVFPDLIAHSGTYENVPWTHTHGEGCTTHSHQSRSRQLRVSNPTDVHVSQSIRVRLSDVERGLTFEWSVPGPAAKSYTIAGIFMQTVQHCPLVYHPMGWGPSIRFEIDVSNLVAETDENNNALTTNPPEGAVIEPVN